MLIIKQFKVDSTIIVQINIITMNRTSISSCIDLSIDIKKIQFRQGDILRPAYN